MPPLLAGAGLGVGVSLGIGGVGIPLAAAPLWIPAFAGMTHRGVWERRERETPRAPPLPWVPGFRGNDGGG